MTSTPTDEDMDESDFDSNEDRSQIEKPLGDPSYEANSGPVSAAVARGSIERLNSAAQRVPEDALKRTGKNLKCTPFTDTHKQLVISDATDPTEVIFEATIAPELAPTAHTQGLHAGMPHPPERQQLKATFKNPKLLGQEFIQEFLDVPDIAIWHVACNATDPEVYKTAILDFIEMSGKNVGKLRFDFDNSPLKEMDGSIKAINDRLKVLIVNANVHTEATAEMPAATHKPGGAASL